MSAAASSKTFLSFENTKFFHIPAFSLRSPPSLLLFASVHLHKLMNFSHFAVTCVRDKLNVRLHKQPEKTPKQTQMRSPPKEQKISNNKKNFWVTIRSLFAWCEMKISIRAMWCFAVYSWSQTSNEIIVASKMSRDWIAIIWRNFCTDTKTQISLTIECRTEKVPRFIAHSTW